MYGDDPSVLVPYPGPATESGYQDIFVFLRPETNGVVVESKMLKVISKASDQDHKINLVFLANVPGAFIVNNKIIEQYYSLRLHFAVMGAQALTDPMKRSFSNFFDTAPEDCTIMGAFEFLSERNLNPEDLFNTWVPEKDVCVIRGQCVKKIDGVYVLNYDIPALLHKNTKGTDIAVMIFRTKADYSFMGGVFRQMRDLMVSEGLLPPKVDASRAYHYSKGPMEQLLDGVSYLYTISGGTIGLKDLSFAHFAAHHGMDLKSLCSYLLNPLCLIRKPNGQLEEANLLTRSHGMSYIETLGLFSSVVEQRKLLHHGPLLNNLCTQHKEASHGGVV